MQEARTADNILANCQKELDSYDDPMHMPVNIDSCQSVMDAVTSPFVQE